MRHLISKNGQSLVTVVMSVGIISAIIGAVTSLSTNMMKQVTTTQMKMDYNNLSYVAQNILGSTTSCAGNFVKNATNNNNFAIPTSAITTGTFDIGSVFPTFQLRYYKSDGTPIAGAVAQIGQNLPGSLATVSAMKLVNINDLGNDQIAASLEITLSHNLSGVVQMRPITIAGLKFSGIISGSNYEVTTCQNSTFQCVTARYKHDGDVFELVSSNPTYTGALTTVFTKIPVADPNPNWGLACNSPWTSTSCSGSGLLDSAGSAQYSSNGCTAPDGTTGSTAATIYATCCTGQ